MALRVNSTKTSVLSIILITSVVGIMIVAGMLATGFISTPFTKQFSQVARAADATDEQYFTFDSVTGTITGYDEVGGPSDVVIPETIGGVAVTAIGDATEVYDEDLEDFVYSGSFVNKGLTSVVIPSSVVTVGAFAFKGNDLTTLTIPNSVTTLGIDAFDDNPLVSLVVGTSDFTGTPSLVISSSAFNSEFLESVTIGNNVVSIVDGAFSSAPSLTYLDLGESVETINNGSLSFTGLTSISIPDSVTSLAGGPFSGNSQLETLVIGTKEFTGEPTLVIGGGLFGGTASLESIVFGNNIKAVTNGAFSSLPALTDLDLGESVQSINNSAFTSTALTELSIPDSVTVLGSSAFTNNTQLVTLNIGTKEFTGEPTLVIGTGVFSNVTSFQSITLGNNVKTVTDGAFSNVPSLTYLDLGESVQNLITSAFATNALTSLTIPNSVVEIRSGAFSNNTELKTLTVGTKEYAGEPSLVIDTGAFASADKLESIVFGNNVKAVTDGAFNSVPALTYLDLGESVEVIREDVFGNAQISTLTIPGSVTEIDTAFKNGQLTGVYLQGTPTIGDKVFSRNGVTSAELVDIVDYTDMLLYLQNNATYVPVYTGSPELYLDTVYKETWDDETFYTVGGYLINATPVNVSNKNSQGTSLMANVFQTGATLSDYDIASNPDADFSLYYRTGDVLSFDAPDISGFVTPASQTITLAAGNNNVNFVYYTAQELANLSAPNTGSLLTQAKGDNVWAYIVAVVAVGVLVVAGTAVYAVRRIK